MQILAKVWTNISFSVIMLKSKDFSHRQIIIDIQNGQR